MVSSLYLAQKSLRKNMPENYAPARFSAAVRRQSGTNCGTAKQKSGKPARGAHSRSPMSSRNVDGRRGHLPCRLTGRAMSARLAQWHPIPGRAHSETCARYNGWNIGSKLRCHYRLTSTNSSASIPIPLPSSPLHHPTHHCSPPQHSQKVVNSPTLRPPVRLPAKPSTARTSLDRDS